MQICSFGFVSYLVLVFSLFPHCIVFQSNMDSIKLLLKEGGIMYIKYTVTVGKNKLFA